MKKVFLLIDIGNTATKLCLTDGVIFTNKKSILYTKHAFIKDLHDVVSNMTSTCELDKIIIASVSPKYTEIVLDVLSNFSNITPILVNYKTPSPININIKDPSEIGCDLYALAVGASIICSKPSIIIDMGTATKFVVVNETKELIGVNITLGIQKTVESLLKNADLIKHFHILDSIPSLGKTTNESLNAGIINGHIDMINGIVNRIKLSYNYDFEIYLTGGLSKSFAKHFSDYTLNENILFIGLLNMLLFTYK